jgi:hypothetical protein
MAGCYFMSAVVYPRRRDGVGPLDLLKLVAVLLVASLATPFGLDGWRYAVLLATEAGPNSSPLFQGLMELTRRLATLPVDFRIFGAICSCWWPLL